MCRRCDECKNTFGDDDKDWYKRRKIDPDSLKFEQFAGHFFADDVHFDVKGDVEKMTEDKTRCYSLVLGRGFIETKMDDPNPTRVFTPLDFMYNIEMCVAIPLWSLDGGIEPALKALVLQPIYRIPYATLQLAISPFVMIKNWIMKIAPKGCNPKSAQKYMYGDSPGAAAERCQVGDHVNCPGGEAQCAGNQCCPDGSVCPSAEASFTDPIGCAKGKVEDCLAPYKNAQFYGEVREYTNWEVNKKHKRNKLGGSVCGALIQVVQAGWAEDRDDKKTWQLKRPTLSPGSKVPGTECTYQYTLYLPDESQWLPKEFQGFKGQWKFIYE